MAEPLPFSENELILVEGFIKHKKMASNAGRKVAGNMVSEEYLLKEIDLYKSMFLSSLLYAVSVEFVKLNIDFLGLYKGSIHNVLASYFPRNNTARWVG